MESILAQYRLSIERRPNHEISRLASKAKELMGKYHVHLSEISFNNFVDYADTACRRMKAGCCLYLAGKRMIGNAMEKDSNFIIQERTDRLAIEIWKPISDDYHMNFRNNFEMRMTWNQHLVPFDVRMRYGIPLKNPLLKDIKEKYSLSFQMAVSRISLHNEDYVS